MSVRPATRSDIPVIVDILTQAFWNEDAVGRFMHPHREIWPDDVKKFWRRGLRSVWWEARHSLLIAVNSEGAVVGYADWSSVGGQNVHTRLSQKLLQVWAKVHNSISSTLSPDRAADPVAITALPRAVHFFTVKLPQPNRNLKTLAVHPSHQGHGYGRLLVQWGLDRAAKDRVPATVITADGTEGFYFTCGFEREIGNVTEGEGNPIAGVKGGVILIKQCGEEVER